MPPRPLPWLVLSALLHGAAGLVLLRLAPAVERQRGLVPITLDLRITRSSDDRAVAGAAQSATSPPEASRAVATPATPPPRARRPRSPRSRANGTPSAPEVEAAVDGRDGASGALVPGEATDAPQGEPSEAPPLTPRVELSPRAAALSLLQREEPPPVSAEARLNRAIAEGAARPRSQQSEEPALRARPEGGYAYSGRGFDALIEPNGNLRMTDRFGSVYLPFQPFQTPDGEWRIALLGGTFRLFDWLDKKIGKNDPYRSERRWFLERTRELRERLAREYAPQRQPTR